jgi:predicted transcriptional regulator YheO
MNHIEDESHFLKQILTVIESQFGDRCEVVLHDLTKDYNHTIVDIRNGQITGRKIGGCGSNLGLEVLNGSVEDGDRFNYITTMPDGKILRSSSVYIRNSEGEAIGSICINMDITDSIRFEGFLRKYNNFAAGQESAPSEFFAQDVNSLLDYMIQEASKLVGKNPLDMNKDERLTFLAYLDRKGALQITKSAERICKVLGVSKFTLYNDLESIRGQGKEKERT